MPSRTGALLVERGVASPEAVERAEVASAREGIRLCSALLRSGQATEGALAGILAERHGWPGVDLSRSEIPADALRAVPAQVARDANVLPLSVEGGRLHLAVAHPDDASRVLAEVRFVSGMEVSPYVAVESSLRQAITDAYAALEGGARTWRGAAATPGSALAVTRALRSRLPPGDEGMADEGLRPAIPPPLPFRGRDLGPRSILVVDDEPEILTLLERALGARGFQIETAPDGEQALARIAERRPALVLLDAMLPRLHGFEVARRLRADPATRDIPVVMMTAVYRGWRFAQDAREAYGAEDYVEKPFRLDDLVRRIEVVLAASTTRTPHNPTGAEVALRRGKELLLAGRIDAAVATLREAVAADPFSAEAQHQLGKALRNQGEHFRAMTAYERAVELRPDLFPALRGLAALYAEKGFSRKAAETLERALTAAPDPVAHDAVRADLLDLLESQGDRPPTGVGSPRE